MVCWYSGKQLILAAAAVVALLIQPDQSRAESRHQMLGTTWNPAAESRRTRVGKNKASLQRHRKTLGARTSIVMVNIVRPGFDGYPTGTSPLQAPKGTTDMFTYSGMVTRYASDNGVPATLVDAVIRVESNYRPNALGDEIAVVQSHLKYACRLEPSFLSFVPDLNKIIRCPR